MRLEYISSYILLVPYRRKTMQCKYYTMCDYANPQAGICVKLGGGTYCGKYRLFSEKQSPDTPDLSAATSHRVISKDMII